MYYFILKVMCSIMTAMFLHCSVSSGWAAHECTELGRKLLPWVAGF